MADREKVIKGLNDIAGFVAGRIGIEQARNFIRTIDDACDLLKEQEAKPVIQDRQCEVEPNVWERKGFCPKCHQIVLWNVNRLFCGFCGQAVKWDD